MIQKGQCFTSKRGEICHVIEYINANNIKVLFDTTGYAGYYRADHLRDGSFIDRSTYEKKGKFYPTSHGNVLVLEDITKSIKLIKFVDTGYIRECRLKNLLTGEVKDKTKPLICGKGFVGEGYYDSSHEGYRKWLSMLKRCYSVFKDGSNKSYLDKEVTVNENWHNFQNFAKWYENYKITYLNEVDITNFQIDKDILGNGLLYSSKNCCLVPPWLNMLHKGINNARGWKNNKSKTKPFTCSLGGVWCKDFKDKQDCITYYGYEKVKYFCVNFKKTRELTSLNLEPYSKVITLIKVKFKLEHRVVCEILQAFLGHHEIIAYKL